MSAPKRRRVEAVVYGFDELGGFDPRGGAAGLEVSFADREADLLGGCDIVILPYDAFVADAFGDDPMRRIVTSVAESERDRRANEIETVLRRGGVVCWLIDALPLAAAIEQYESVKEWCSQTTLKQLRPYPGAAYLHKAGCQMLPLETALPYILCARREFSVWFEKSTTTKHMVFVTNERQFQAATVVCTCGDEPNGIAVESGKGLAVFLPYVPGSALAEEQASALTELAGALWDFQMSLGGELPEWVQHFVLSREGQLRVELEELRSRQSSVEERILPYEGLKRLLVLSGDELTDLVVDTLSRYGLPTGRLEEEYKEDFWLISDSGERLAVCEVKGLKANVGRKEVNDADTHRDENKLSHSFPCILVANTFRTRASSLTEKDHQVELGTVQHAVRQNVLIVRTFDLLRLIDRIETGDKTKEQVLDLLTQNCGWLHVPEDGEPTIVRA